MILADRQYARELQGDETEAQIFILKNRDGRTGRVKATFNVRKLRFDGVEENPAATNFWVFTPAGVRRDPRGHGESTEKEKQGQ